MGGWFFRDLIVTVQRLTCDHIFYQAPVGGFLSYGMPMSKNYFNM